MARIPLSEVPNAPGLVGPPASVKYPGAPSVQLSNQPYSNYRAATLPNIANFEKYAGELKQSPLPAGFAQGAEMAESALGSYAYSVAGKATKELGDAVSTGMLSDREHHNQIGEPSE